MGKFVEQDHSISTIDLRVKIDQALEVSCMTPLNIGDTQLLDEVTGEMMIHVIGRKINREQRRKK
jgi:hypothetical protein